MNVFNMNEVGKRISKLRKEKNMTQVELADRLEISYQAVSNWERGDSMPDIAKLSDLSTIFDISIDELLGNSKAAKVVEDIIHEKEVDIKDLSNDELKTLLPLVKPEQFKKSFHRFENLPFEMIILMAPFLEEEDIDSWVSLKYQSEASSKWIALVPFMSQKSIHITFDAILEKEKTDLGWLAGFAPFVDSKKLNQVAYDIYERKGISNMVVLAPFVDDTIIDQIIEHAIKNGKYQDVMVLFPFSSGKEKNDFSNIFSFFNEK